MRAKTWAAWGMGLACLLAVASATAADRRPKALFKEQELFDDHAFAAPSVVIDPKQVFALDDTMRQYLHEQMGRELQLKGPRQALFDALYQAGQLKLDYDAAMTRNAREAFAARSGNCLSLVILTAAMAKELGIPVQYQNVFIEDSWSRDADLTYYDGHVNVSLASPRQVGRIANMGQVDGGVMTIDFVSPDALKGRRARVVSEDTIIAMYLNNRSAESLARGQVDDAYWWVRAALRQDPRFYAAYNTLAVVYRRHGDNAHAERLLAGLLAQEPDNVITLTNMVLVQRDLGHAQEAAVLEKHLKEIQPFPPFFFFDQGVAAMKAGEFAKARDLFAREVQRAGHYHEFQFWLAVAELRLGDMRSARTHLELALENSTTADSHDLYAAKLSHLKQIERESHSRGRGWTEGSN
jgi:tetratricopeptide (TPR) repeat protein